MELSLFKSSKYSCCYTSELAHGLGTGICIYLVNLNLVKVNYLFCKGA